MNNENEVAEVQVERVDDIPVIYGHLQKMHIQATIDRVITPHGNWQGLSPGWVITIWLIHILSEHTHCMARVQSWVAQRLHALQALTGQPVRELDFTADRLALCLELLSAAAAWQALEAQLSQHLVRVYRLGEEPTVRLDGSTGTVYHDPEQPPLFKVGKAKSGEFATQYKLMLASLDPLGLTLAVDVVAGNRAEDPLYVSCYQRVKEVFPESELLVVGDSKMIALETRGTIAAAGDVYLTPLAQRKAEPALLATLLAPWWEREAELARIFLPEDWRAAEGSPDPDWAVAYGFTMTRSREAPVGEETVRRQERLLVVRSFAYARSSQKWLHRRLDQAEQALRALTPPRGRGKRQITSAVELLAAIQRIEEKYRVQGFFMYDYHHEVTERQIRAYGDRPARPERRVRDQLPVTREAEALAEAEFKTGWHIYAPNVPAERLPLTEAVLAYREQYLAENIFRRLPGQILSITPVYVQRDDHAQGLFQLLTLGARGLALGD